jgi:hypothetical protein
MAELVLKPQFLKRKAAQSSKYLFGYEGSLNMDALSGTGGG